MNAQGLEAMRTLRDVEGVLGSFVIADDGSLRLRDCPSVFDDGSLGEAGARLVRLREAIDADGDPLELAVLEYADHKLFIRAMQRDTFVAIVSRTVNLPALKMGVSLVVRRLERWMSEPASAPTPVDAPRLAEPPPPPIESAVRSTTPTVPARPRVYRGTRVT